MNEDQSSSRGLNQMSLGMRVLSALVIVWVLLLGGLHLILESFVEPSYIALETKLAGDDLKRVQGAFAQDLDALSNYVKDYSVWDDMVTFAKEPNDAFRETNLNDNVFETLNIQFLFIYGPERKPVFAKTWTPETGLPLALSEADPNLFVERFPILSPAQEKGPFGPLKRAGTFALSDGRLVEVAAHPILTSAELGPVTGTVVFGRLIDESFLEKLGKRLNLPFVLKPIKPKSVPQSVAPFVTRSTVIASVIWTDLFKNPIAEIHLERPAAIVLEGNHTLRVTTLSSLAVLSLVLVFLLVILQFSVIAPLGKLSSTIAQIEATGNLDARVHLERGDEIGSLADKFDHMLSQLSERAVKLERLATSDELTSLYNRRFIMDFLHQEIESSIRYQHGLAILLLDIDYFKRINDTAGHATGDRVLKNIAKTLRETMRETDRVGRYGGEEFLVVMPYQTPEGAEVAAERLRKAIEAGDAHGLPWAVTVSIGVAVWSGHTREALLFIADKNLYRAKDAGRNRVVATPVPNEELPKSSLVPLHPRSRVPRSLN